MTRQLDTRPSAFTWMLTPIVPLLTPVAASFLYSRLGMVAIWRAGVKREKSPPPPGPLPVPSAPVPVPEVPAPEVDAFPAPATLAAGIGEGRGSFGSGATM